MAKPAYTYIVGWLDRDVYYYGFRSHAKDKAPESDLWGDYFTSSKHVAAFRAEYGEPDLVEVDRRFPSIRAAKDYETWYLRTVADIRSPKWLNKADGAGGFCHDIPHSDSAKAKMRKAKVGRVPWNKGIRGVVKQSPESIARRAAKNTGKKRSQETKDAIGAANRGRIKTPDTIEKFKASINAYYENNDGSWLGRRHSEESKKKMSESLKGRKVWNKGMKNPVAITDETRKKISEKVKQSWAARKALTQGE